MPAQKFTQQDIDQLSAWLQRRYEAQFSFQTMLSIWKTSLGLRGLWITSAFNSAGDLTDYSGRGHHMTINGDPDFDSDGLMPYADLDGAGDYFSLNDTADFDITATETYVASAAQGLTMVCWTYVDVITALDAFMSKWGAAGQRSYLLRMTASGVEFLASVDGTAQSTVSTAASTLTAATWTFAAGRFKQSSSELKVWANGNTNTAAAPASIFNSNAQIQLGQIAAGGRAMDGRLSFCAIYATALDDVTIETMRQQSRAIVGV